MSSDCPSQLACLRQKCEDPCPGTCGINARCQVVNHSPICSCPPLTTGDPFIRCIDSPEQPILDETEPCNPSPCGANSECRVVNNHAACSCVSGMKGLPPNCRPECTDNSECPFNLACINYHCKNPCINVCGSFSECRVMNHQAMCYCSHGNTGDPFLGCSPSMFNYH